MFPPEHRLLERIVDVTIASLSKHIEEHLIRNGEPAAELVELVAELDF